MHTIISEAMEFFTFSSMLAHFLTPISGALFLINSTTSSTNERVLEPIGPPYLAEKSIFNFWEPLFILLMATDKPLRAPRPPFLGPAFDPYIQLTI